MAMSVEQRREISRNDTWNSTGPKSRQVQGMERSQLDAPGYGLCDEIVALPEEDPAPRRRSSGEGGTRGPMPARGVVGAPRRLGPPWPICGSDHAAHPIM